MYPSCSRPGLLWPDMPIVDHGCTESHQKVNLGHAGAFPRRAAVAVPRRIRLGAISRHAGGLGRRDCCPCCSRAPHECSPDGARPKQPVGSLPVCASCRFPQHQHFTEVYDSLAFSTLLNRARGHCAACASCSCPCSVSGRQAASHVDALHRSCLAPCLSSLVT